MRHSRSSAFPLPWWAVLAILAAIPLIAGCGPWWFNASGSQGSSSYGSRDSRASQWSGSSGGCAFECDLNMVHGFPSAGQSHHDSDSASDDSDSSDSGGNDDSSSSDDDGASTAGL